MTPKRKAMLASFGRIFAAAALAAYLNLGKAPLDLRAEDLKILFNAGIGAALLTLVNYLRQGETRFGTNSQDIGMGGADALGADGKVQTPPDGARVDPAVALADSEVKPPGIPAAEFPEGNLDVDVDDPGAPDEINEVEN